VKLLEMFIVLGLLLALMALPTLADAEAVDINGKLYHVRLKVYSRDLKKVEFYASNGTWVEIVMHVGDVVRGICVAFGRITDGGVITDSECEIYVEIIRPDGSIEFPKSRVSFTFNYTFRATVPGTYIIILDNLYSSLDKDVDLAIAGFPQPATVTRTYTYSATTTVERTVTSTYTTTEAVTITTTMLTTLTMEREAGSMTTALSAAALAAAVIAIALALLLRRR